MGWIGTFIETGRSQAERLKACNKEFFGEKNKDWAVKIADYMKDNIYYALCYHIGYKHNFILVADTDIKEGCLIYKAMTSEVGPYAYDCPLEWFEQAPIQNKDDKEWREKCRQHQERERKKKQMLKQLSPGDVLVFEKGYTDKNIKEWVFSRKHNRTYYFKLKGSEREHRLLNWRKQSFTVQKNTQEQALF